MNCTPFTHTLPTYVLYLDVVLVVQWFGYSPNNCQDVSLNPGKSYCMKHLKKTKMI